VQQGQDAFTFTIPARGFGRLAPLVVFLAGWPMLVPLAGLIAHFLTDPFTRNLVVGIPCCAGCLPYLIGLLVFVLPATFAWKVRDEVLVRPGVIRVERLGPGHSEQTTLSIGEITRVEIARPKSRAYNGGLAWMYGPRNVVQLHTRTRQVEFGGWLSDEDRMWLRDTVMLLASA
jgi:hypothetical protein